MDEDYPAGPEITEPLPGQSNWRGSESSILEIAAYVWCYTLIVVHIWNECMNERYTESVTAYMFKTYKTACLVIWFTWRLIAADIRWLSQRLMSEVNEVMVLITRVTGWELILQTSTDAIPNTTQFSDSVISTVTATMMQ